MECLNINLAGVKELVAVYGEVMTSKILDVYEDRIPTVEEASNLVNNPPLDVIEEDYLSDVRIDPQYQTVLNSDTIDVLIEFKQINNMLNMLSYYKGHSYYKGDSYYVDSNLNVVKNGTILSLLEIDKLKQDIYNYRQSKRKEFKFLRSTLLLNISNYTDNDYYSNLSDILLNYLDKLRDTPVTLKDYEKDNTSGQYTLYKDELTLKNYNEKTYLHEVLHNFTATTIDKVEYGVSDNPLEIDYYNKINELFKFAKQNTTDYHYGLRDIHEFIAEAFTNKDFQKYLKNLVLDKEHKPTIWQRFIDILSDYLNKLFGYNEYTNVLDETINLTLDFISRANYIDLTSEISDIIINIYNIEYNREDLSDKFIIPYINSTITYNSATDEYLLHNKTTGEKEVIDKSDLFFNKFKQLVGTDVSDKQKAFSFLYRSMSETIQDLKKELTVLRFGYKQKEIESYSRDVLDISKLSKEYDKGAKQQLKRFIEENKEEVDKFNKDLIQSLNDGNLMYYGTYGSLPSNGLLLPNKDKLLYLNSTKQTAANYTKKANNTKATPLVVKILGSPNTSFLNKSLYNSDYGLILDNGDDYNDIMYKITSGYTYFKMPSTIEKWKAFLERDLQSIQPQSPVIEGITYQDEDDNGVITNHTLNLRNVKLNIKNDGKLGDKEISYDIINNINDKVLGVVRVRKVRDTNYYQIGNVSLFPSVKISEQEYNTFMSQIIHRLSTIFRDAISGFRKRTLIGKGVGQQVYAELNNELKTYILISDDTRSNNAEIMWQALERKGLAEKFDFKGDTLYRYKKDSKDSEELTALKVKYSQELIDVLKTRLANNGITNADNLIGVRETINNVDADKFWSNVTRKDLDTLLAKYAANKQEQLNDFVNNGSEEYKFIEEKGIFISSDTSFFDNKIKEIIELRDKLEFKEKTIKTDVQEVSSLKEAISGLTEEQKSGLDTIERIINNNILRKSGLTVEEYTENVKYFKINKDINNDEVIKAINILFPILETNENNFDIILNQPNTMLTNVINFPKFKNLGFDSSKTSYWIAKYLTTTENGKQILNKSKTKEDCLKYLNDYFTELGEVIKHSDKYYLTNLSDELIQANINSKEAQLDEEYRQTWLEFQKNKEQRIQERNKEQKVNMLMNYDMFKNTNHYSIGLKLLVLESLLKKSTTYNVELDKVSEKDRDNKTITTPPVLNELFLAKLEESSYASSNKVMYDYYYEKSNYKGTKIDLEDYKSNIYQKTDLGVWYKFNGEKDLDKFFKMSGLSQGYPGAWCTGAYNTAKSYLMSDKSSTMYLFYSIEENNPTLQLHVVSNQAKEIGGLAAGQDFRNNEDYQVLEKFFKDNTEVKEGGLQNYLNYKKVIIKYDKNPDSLTYEDWDKINEGNQYYKDNSDDLKNLKELIPKSYFTKKYNVTEDYIIDGNELHIKLEAGEDTSEYIIIGSYTDYRPIIDTKLFKVITGSVYLSNLKSTTTKLFDTAGGNVILYNLKSTTTKLFDTVNGEVNLYNLKSTTTKLFDTVNGNVILNNLESTTTKLFDTAGGYADLSSLESTTTKLFDTAGGDVYLSSLESTDIKLFDTAGGEVNLYNLKSTTTKLFDTAGGYVDLENLESTDTKLFDTAGFYVYLYNLKSTTTQLFDTAGGEVNLYNLESTATKLFDTAGGYVNLNSLKSTDIKLFDKVNGSVNLYNLESTDTKLFDTAGGNVNLNNLKSTTTKLYDTAGGSVILSSLESTTTKLYDKVNGSVYLSSLKSTTTKLFDTAGGSVDLSNLESTDTKLFDTAGGSVNLNNLISTTTKLFDKVNGDVNLNSLESTDIKLFDTVNGYVYLNQGNKGLYLSNHNTSYLVFGKNSDLTTAIHEKAHEFEKYLDKEDIKTLEEWSGYKKGTVAFSEAFAKGAEKVIYEGLFADDSTPVGKIFNKFAKWFKNIIENAITYFGDINELNDEVKNVYAKMFLENVVEDNLNITKTVKSNLIDTIGFTEERKTEIIDNFASKYNLSKDKAIEYINEALVRDRELTINKLKECY